MRTLEELEAKADELYNYTLTAIADYREQIDALKEVLMDLYVLSKDAIFSLLAQQSVKQGLRES